MNQTPQAEYVEFPDNCPCRLRSRTSKVDEIGVPHYASTVEIVLTEKAQGVVCMGNESFTVNEERDAFFTAPHVVHSGSYKRGSRIHVFKISIEMLSKYLDLDALLASSGCSMLDIPCHLTDSYDVIHRYLFERIRYDGDNFATVKALVGLFEYLCGISKNQVKADKKPTNDKILDVIKWTQERVCERISVDDAAAHLHYSKYHFCRLFKESVGTTYLHYLNTLKIDKAIELLREGRSATYCCYECGFDSLAYFLKLFKEVTGVTTTEYRKMLENGEYDADK